MIAERKTVLMIAGEASGDTLGAELIEAVRQQPGGDEIDFIGAGGPRMEAAALQPEFDLSEHAVVGIWEVLKSYFKFRRQSRNAPPPWDRYRRMALAKRRLKPG